MIQVPLSDRIERVSRSGKVYYLHEKPGKGGKPNFFFSTDPSGQLAEMVSDGFEIYETGSAWDRPGRFLNS